MKKKILSLTLTLILALILCFALASCDSSETPDPTEPPTEPPTESCTHEYDNSCDADCNLCGETRTASHSVETIEAVAPTCTQTGLTEGKYCSVCDEVVEEQKVVDATGHIEIIDISKPASCSEEGLTQGSHCNVCGEVIVAQEVIEKTAHLGGLIIQGVQPTCTQTGLTQGEKCFVCEEVVVEQTVLEKLPHNEIPIIGTPASCTATGLTEGKKCVDCGEITVEQAVIEALGHEYSETYLHDSVYHWRKCTHSGCSGVIDKEEHDIRKYNCAVCNYYNGPKVYNIFEYRPTPINAYDVLYIAYDQVAGTGMSSSVDDILQLAVPFGEGVRMNGWIGFNIEIKSFGYWFNDEVYNVKTSEDFFVETEQGVIAAGGQYARRFSIAASTSGVDNITSVSFVAELVDGTYVVLKRLDVTVTGGPEMGEIVPDDEIIKAEPETLTGGEKLVASKLTTGENLYSTKAGLKYTAIGAGAAYANGKFNISGSFKITFEENYERFAEDFNKYKISYSSTTPLKAIVTYTDGDTIVTDVVYLEAGDHMFSCLTLGYINGIFAKNITSVEVQPLGSETATFVLYDLTTEEAEVISGSITYIVNERYALGIKLTWGGGISYLLDKEDNNDGIGNLVNCADAGRLVQQSYYGTKDPSEYELGEFHGNAWGYNPVQGGNKHNEPSRIIDVQISGPSIYVKAQPRDWAKHDLTSSYMENVYTLYSDRIQVDNRFTDFSGFKRNPYTSQELPAFYTIGYLNTFVNYGGENPWAGEALDYDNDLGFWTEDPKATKRLEDGNTETWCAWVNEADDYGIGVYTPNISEFFAGRLGYDESPDEMESTAQACSYVAAIGYFKLVSYEAIEYSYLITTGSTQEMRDLFTEHKDFADNADLTDPKFGR